MLNQITSDNLWILALIAVWTLPWKGVALWRAAKRKEMWWFIAMLVINSAAILEITYVFYFSDRPIKQSDEETDESLT